MAETTTKTRHKLVGQNYTTPDLVAKVTGKAKYAEDYRAEGMLFTKLLLSPMPHARVTRLDTSAALAMPGVKAILTADDLPGAQAGATLGENVVASRAGRAAADDGAGVRRRADSRRRRRRRADRRRSDRKDRDRIRAAAVRRRPGRTVCGRAARMRACRATSGCVRRRRRPAAGRAVQLRRLPLPPRQRPLRRRGRCGGTGRGCGRCRLRRRGAGAATPGAGASADAAANATAGASAAARPRRAAGQAPAARCSRGSGRGAGRTRRQARRRPPRPADRRTQVDRRRLRRGQGRSAADGQGRPTNGRSATSRRASRRPISCSTKPSSASRPDISRSKRGRRWPTGRTASCICTARTQSTVQTVRPSRAGVGIRQPKRKTRSS